MAGRSVPGRLLGTRHGVALAAARQQELQVAARPVQAAGRQAGRQAAAQRSGTINMHSVAAFGEGY